MRCVSLTTRMLIHRWLLVGCTHDRFAPIRPDGNVDLCGRVHSALRLSQPSWINEWNGQHCAGKMYINHSFTLLMPFIDASNSAIFASSNAFPPRTARNWNPIGTTTIPRAVIPKAIIGSMLFRCLWRARSTSISKQNKKAQWKWNNTHQVVTHSWNLCAWRVHCEKFFGCRHANANMFRHRHA